MMPTVLLLAACLTDIKFKKVLNWFIVASFLIVLSSHLIFGGRETLFEGFTGLFMAFLLVLPMFLMKALSAGDVKVFVVFGFSTNVDTVIFTFIASLVWGAFIGATRVMFNKQGDILLNNFVKIIKFQKPERHTLHQIPFTVALLAGWFTFIVYSGYGRAL